MRLLESVVLELLFIALSALATRGYMPGALNGFPLPITRQILRCVAPNPANVCGFAIDYLSLIIDYVFWLAIAASSIFALEKIRSSTQQAIQRS